MFDLHSPKCHFVLNREFVGAASANGLSYGPPRNSQVVKESNPAAFDADPAAGATIYKKKKKKLICCI